jgi:hypothetical protein
MNGKNWLMVFDKDVNILDGRIHTIKKNTEVLVVAVKKSGPDVNVEKIYVAISPDQQAGKNYNIKVGNKSF